MTDKFEKDPVQQSEPNVQDISLDELIRSTHEEIHRADAMMQGIPVEKGNAPLPEDATRKFTSEELEQLQKETPAVTVEDTATLKLPEEEEEPRSLWRKMPFGLRTFVYVVLVLIFSVLLAVCGWILLDDVCALTGVDKTVVITVDEQDSVGDVTDKLQQAGLIEYPWLFRAYCVLANAEEKIRPGSYSLNDLLDYHALVNSMASVAQRATVEVMIPEGYEVRQIFELLEKKGVCTAAELWSAAANEEFDYEFLAGTTLGDRNRLEGCLFPDTYEFYVGDNARNVLLKFLRNTDKKLTDKYYAALDELNASLRVRKAQNGFSQQEIAAGELSMHDLLIVASLIEKEAANLQEATTIASVIYNRLCSKLYPCLNIDATIQYILEERKEVLSQQDTLIDSPYNTYKYPGLPAGPISNPGMSSIRGALYPAETNYYFYALGDDGVHHFFRTYSEHLAFIGGYAW